MFNKRNEKLGFLSFNFLWALLPEDSKTDRKFSGSVRQNAFVRRSADTFDMKIYCL